MEFPGNLFFSEKMKIRNFQIENKLSRVKIKKKIQVPLFSVLNPLTYILAILILVRIIIASSRILVNFLRVSILFEKMEH